MLLSSSHRDGNAFLSFLLACAPISLFASEAWWDRLPALPAADEPIPLVIDRLIERRLADRGIAPAGRARPETRLRRVTLDLHGRIPTVAERHRFLNDSVSARWELQVDDLLESPGFDRHLSHEWNWLLMDGKATDFRKFLDAAVREQKPWSAIFEEVITGLADEGDLLGVDFFLRDRARDLDRMTNDVSVRFFGVNISCAQCHDHPYVKDWTQGTYYGMRSFFSRTFENGGFVGERGYGTSHYKTTTGEEREAKLRFLGGEPLVEEASLEPDSEEKKEERKLLEEFKKKKQAPPPPTYSRRSRLVEAGLREGEEWMARSLVNRTWHSLFGYGLVMPLDQMHGENEPSHPELLQWLARDLIEHDYDVRRLVRGIVLSEAYQRESTWDGGRRPHQNEFAVAHPRPLTPRQYAIALKFGASRPSHFSGDLDPEELSRRIESTERSGAGLARWFDRPGENFHVAVDEALLFSNSGEIQGYLIGAGLRDELLALPSHRERIDLAFRSILVREPEPEEVERLENYLSEREDRLRAAVGQMMWAIMAGTEARFNH